MVAAVTTRREGEKSSDVAIQTLLCRARMAQKDPPKDPSDFTEMRISSTFPWCSVIGSRQGLDEQPQYVNQGENYQSQGFSYTAPEELAELATDLR